MSHVVPDLVQKVLKGQDPLHILGDGDQVRHYTYGGDLARGIVDRDGAPGRAQRGLQPLDRRVDHGARAGRADLAQDQGPDVPFRLRAATRLRARRAEAGARRREGHARCSASRRPPSLDEMLDEVIPWIEQAIEDGTI